MNLPARFNVLGVGVSALSLTQAGELVLAQALRRHKGYICVTGVHGVMEAQRDPGFRRILNQATLNTPDGMPMVWLGRYYGHHETTRVYGPDLLLHLCDSGRAHGLRHFFYGGAPGVAGLLRDRLCTRFPGLQVVGTYTPPFRDLTAEELAELQYDLTAKSPHVVWVGLSTPKQERFMAGHYQRLDGGIMIGVGAAFDFHSGRVKQAPPWMQRSGLEWFYRLIREPKRLGPRYLVNNPCFLFHLVVQITRLRKYPLV